MTESQKMSKLMETMKKRLSPERFERFVETYEQLKKENEVKTS
jgi:PHD/YefM family antitoxin component YafN of YafNO toxin-antitoxin module